MVHKDTFYDLFMKGLTSIVDFSETICRNTYCVILVGAEIFELTRAKLKIVTYKAYNSNLSISFLNSN